jgi:CTP:molybdopterin cytidylyltransferase MocA
VNLVEIPDAEEGMAASLRAGAEWALPRLLTAPDPTSYAYHGLLVLLPDMPGPSSDDMVRMAAAHQARGGPVVRAVDATGRAGHPVLFPLHLLHEFEHLEGDRGAARLIEEERIVEVELEGDRATRDLDTPEDWAAWRATRQP